MVLVLKFLIFEKGLFLSFFFFLSGNEELRADTPRIMLVPSNLETSEGELHYFFGFSRCFVCLKKKKSVAVCARSAVAASSPAASSSHVDWDSSNMTLKTIPSGSPPSATTVVADGTSPPAAAAVSAAGSSHAGWDSKTISSGSPPSSTPVVADGTAYDLSELVFDSRYNFPQADSCSLEKIGGNISSQQSPSPSTSSSSSSNHSDFEDVPQSDGFEVVSVGSNQGDCEAKSDFNKFEMECHRLLNTLTPSTNSSAHTTEPKEKRNNLQFEDEDDDEEEEEEEEEEENPFPFITPGEEEQFSTLGFKCEGATPFDFVGKILNPCLSTNTEEDLKIQAKNIEACEQWFLALAMYMSKVGVAISRLNKDLFQMDKGCQNVCPIHCINHVRKKIRKGKFKLKRTKQK